jgi:hypothetical protein
VLLFRKSLAQARIDLPDPRGSSENDYAVVEETRVVARIYKELIDVEPKWLWFPETAFGAALNNGVANTLEDAKAEFARRYEEVEPGEMMGRSIVLPAPRWRAPIASWKLAIDGRARPPMTAPI